MNKFLDAIGHYWSDHKKAVIIVGIILVILLFL